MTVTAFEIAIAAIVVITGFVIWVGRRKSPSHIARSENNWRRDPTSNDDSRFGESGKGFDGGSIGGGRN